MSRSRSVQDSDEIKALEDRRYRAMLAGDTAALDELCSDDLIYTHSKADHDDKASYLHKVGTRYFTYLEITHPADRILVVEGAALVTGRMTAKVLVQGYFSRKDGTPLMLAGIWEEAEYKGDKRPAFAILTAEPNGLVASYHDRMPLALGNEKVALWLDLSQESPLDQTLLLDIKEFSVRPMDRAMNNSRQKDLAAIDPEAKTA
jgi:SOS response associated peptidase (SRAP)/Domain of unknown function (DUF4440)